MHTILLYNPLQHIRGKEMKNLFVLWRQVLKNPRGLGTIAPSSPYLAKAVADAAAITHEYYVVEIGAGTGPLTEELSTRVHPDKFMIFEPNPDMATILREKYPQFPLYVEYASKLPQICAEKSWAHVDVVVSSIPWSLLKEKDIEETIDAVCKVLAPQGKMFTLVYAHAQYFPSSLTLEKKFNQSFEKVYRTKIVLGNIPPGYFLVGDTPKKTQTT